MNSTQIERVKLDAVQEYVPLCGDLFDESKAQLGYDVGEVTKAERDLNHLREVIGQSGISILRTKQVNSYRNAEERKANHIGLRVLGHIAVFVLVNFGLYWCDFFPQFFSKTRPYPSNSDFVFGCALTLLINGIGCGLLAGFALWSNADNWEWKYTELRGYKKPVPEFALAYALAIQKIEPHVRFDVCELAYEKRVADPFLMVSYGESGGYYIAVWDEPKFEGRKTA